MEMTIVMFVVKLVSQIARLQGNRINDLYALK